MSIHVTDNYYTNKKCSGGSNFWQGMGMGVLGQITGMGGFGIGGYGMGGYGMGCCGGSSIWNMSGMYNCGFGGYGMGYGFGNAWGMNDSYLGATLSMMGVGMITKGISEYIDNRNAKKAEAEKPKTKADFMAQAETEVDNKTPIFKNNVNDGKSKVEKLDNASSKIANIKSTINVANATITNLTDKLENLKNQQSVAPESRNDGDTTTKIKDDFNDEIQNLEKQITNEKEKIKKAAENANEIDGININVSDDVTTHDIDNAYEAAKTEANEKLEKAKSDRADEIDNVAQKLLDEYNKEAQKNAEKEMQQTKLLNDINGVDGNSWSRTKASKLIDKYDNQDNNTKYDDDDVQGALAGYKKSVKNNGTYKGKTTEEWKTILNAIKSQGKPADTKDTTWKILSDVA